MEMFNPLICLILNFSADLLWGLTVWLTRGFLVTVPSEDGTRLQGEDIAYDFMFQLTINLSFTCPE